MPINIDWNASAYFPPEGGRQEDVSLTDEELRAKILDVRDETIALLLKAAQKLEREPDNPDHIYQINYCARNYTDAQLILNPKFFGD